MSKSSAAPPPSFIEFNDQATLCSRDRLADYQDKNKAARSAEQRLAEEIVPSLALRCFHIPGYTYWQDLGQYFTNNHPVLGLCCHHRLHPIGTGKRIVVLIGSLGFGLAVSNIIYLYFLNKVNGFDSSALALNFNTTVQTGSLNITLDEISITDYQVVLWGLGGPLHSMFDLSIWFISACACCQPGGSMQCCSRYMWLGSHFVLFAVVLIAAMASFIVVLRATLNSNDQVDISDLESAGIFDDAIDLTNAGADDYRFLVSWCIELVLALFCYNFLLGTILFSGVLGCGKLPFLGGRPREMMMEEYRLQKERKRQEKMDKKANESWIKRKPKDDDGDLEWNAITPSVAPSVSLSAAASAAPSTAKSNKSSASYTKASVY